MADHRDRYFHLEEPILTPYQLAAEGGIDASHKPPIWNQLRLGSCVPHGSIRAFLTEMIRQGASLADLPMLSRLFVYAEGRKMEGTDLSVDSGMVVRDAIRVLATQGVPLETEWPYSDAKPGPFQDEPPAGVVQDARQHMAVKYQQIIVGGPGAPMRTALSKGLAIVMGFPVPDYFEDASVWDPASEEPLPLPGPDTQYIGGHCTAVMRWNFSGRFVSTPTTNRRVRPYFTNDNSWDTPWGMGGSFNIDAEWFSPRRGLASDLWVIQATT
jgi:C1A family cysteine protease